MAQLSMLCCKIMSTLQASSQTHANKGIALQVTNTKLIRHPALPRTHVITIHFGTLALMKIATAFCCTSGQQSGILFTLGTCRGRPACTHQTLCLCLAGAKGTVSAVARYLVVAWQMQRVQSTHSPDAVPGLIACMQCATRAAAACTTAGQICACSACTAMTTFISSSCSGFSTLEYCRLSKLVPEGASGPALTSEGGAAILHLGFCIKGKCAQTACSKQHT